MAFYAGYFCGVISAGVLLFAGYWLALWRYVPPEKGVPQIPRPAFFPAKKRKHVPKSVSEEKQADLERGGPSAETERLRKEHFGKE